MLQFGNSNVEMDWRHRTDGKSEIPKVFRSAFSGKNRDSKLSKLLQLLTANVYQA